jgi:ABC-2 type transport system permease protein
MADNDKEGVVASGPEGSGTMGTVPRTWEQVLKLTRFQFRDYLRSRRFLLMLGIVACLGAILTAIVGYYRPVALMVDAPTFYSSIWGGGVGIVIVFAGVIFGGDALAGEFQNKTGYFLMSLPIRRSAIYVGKYIAALAAALIAVVFFALIVIGNGVYYFGASDISYVFAESFLLAFVYLLALLGATFLFSSLFKTSTYATLVVAVLFIFGFTLLQAVIADLVKVEPWFIISYAQGIVSYPFLSTLPPHVVTTIIPGRGGGTFTTYNPTYLEGILIMLGYFVITAVIGLFMFEHEEFT